MENNKTPPPPFELKLEHSLKHQPKSKGFSIDVNAKILRRGSSSPLQEIYFSSTVDDFIWEDEDCPEKVELYELLVDSGIIEFEAQFLIHDIILHVCEITNSLDDDCYKGVLTLTVDVTLPPEPVEVNHAGSEQTQSQEATATTIRRWLKPKHKIQKATYKIGADGMSLILSNQ